MATVKRAPIRIHEWKRRLHVLGLSYRQFAEHSGYELRTVYTWSEIGSIPLPALRVLEMLEEMERFRLGDIHAILKRFDRWKGGDPKRLRSQVSKRQKQVTNSDAS